MGEIREICNHQKWKHVKTIPPKIAPTEAKPLPCIFRNPNAKTLAIGKEMYERSIKGATMRSLAEESGLKTWGIYKYIRTYEMAKSTG